MDRKILVVDDEAAIRNAFELAFRKAGYSVYSAENARDAMELLKKEHIPVMFLDLNMPEMSGVELVRRIRQNDPIAIINAVTGYTSLFDLADCREAGFDDYFTKPVELSVLCKAAADAFEKLDRWVQ
ncbi:MAG: response regulator [Deltaproteobacteria bacterium]|nr:response regulator [Deltaproteobacteria bacterium]